MRAWVHLHRQSGAVSGKEDFRYNSCMGVCGYNTAELKYTRISSPITSTHTLILDFISVPVCGRSSAVTGRMRRNTTQYGSRRGTLGGTQVRQAPPTVWVLVYCIILGYVEPWSIAVCRKHQRSICQYSPVFSSMQYSSMRGGIGPDSDTAGSAPLAQFCSS